MASLITLKGDITLSQIEGFYNQVKAAFQEGGEVVLNCKELTYLDTASFQVLVSLKKSLGNRPLFFQEVPSPILESAELIGVATFLKLKE
ncbi:MAG: STAS domain-containing protein [Syntrophales bacterium]